MTIYSVVLNYKTKDATLACVQSLKKATIPSGYKHQIIVVDNASGDGIERALSAHHTDVLFIQTGANLGYTGGNNAGLRWILENKKKKAAPDHKDDFVFIVNNDTYFKETCIIALYKAAIRHPNSGILSPKIYFTPSSYPRTILDKDKKQYEIHPGEEVIWYAGGEFDWDNILGSNRGVDQVDQGQFDQEEQIVSATGCALFMPLTVLEKIQSFDNAYFMYYEDMDLCVRVKKAGFEIWYIPQATMWHHNAHSSGVGSPLQDYFIVRNRLIFGLKYARVRTKLALLKEAWSFRTNPTKWTAVKDFILLHWNKGSFIS